MVSAKLAAKDNLLKLKELTEKICDFEDREEGKYKQILKEIQYILETAKDKGPTRYEKVCEKIQIMLNNLKLG